MPHNAPVNSRVSDLNERYRHHSATAVLKHALADAQVGKTALVSSFGAESVVLLHMVSVIAPATPVLFLETQMLFPETLAYQQEVAELLELRNVQVIRPDAKALAARDPADLLHKTSTDDCCALRKTEPLQAALAPFHAWITGRKRFQGGARQTLEFFENEADLRIKVNPLAHWAPDDIREYMINNRLPRHPLVARGYPSIGCAPCTSQVAEGEDPRAGRWRGDDKEECGIHFVNGKMVRGPMPAEEAEMTQTQANPVTQNVVVRDDGFTADDWPAADAGGDVLELAPDTDPTTLAGMIDGVARIRVEFPSFADGRGFTIGRQLRLMGYQGRLRAAGHVIADQYAMARRCGFDEVEITPELAARQPQGDWLSRANWRGHDYRSRLRA